MNETCLKLTAYFGERQRTDGRFLAEAMLDLFGTHDVATSVMLRGIESYGPHNLLRTDQSLSLSEDPPVAIAAVDRPSKITGLVDDVVAMTSGGMVTLERARLAAGDVAGVTLADRPESTDAVKLTIYVGRQERIAGLPAYRAVCDLLHRNGFAGASAFLGVDGTAHGQRHRARFFSRNVNVPMMIIAVGTAGQVSGVVPELGELLRNPLLTVERVRVCKRDGQLVARPQALPAVDESGLMLRQKLMVHTSEATLGPDRQPIHRGLVRRLRRSGTASGATALRGIWGFHGDHPPHGDKLIQATRQVPVATIIVDTPERIAHSFDVVDELTGRHGLVTSEMVPAALLIDGAQRLGGTRLADYGY